MLQSINCIRMGQLLIDENLQLFMLCNNCHTDLKNINDFRRHLEKCEGLEHIFQEQHKLKYNTDKGTQLFGRSAKGIKEYIIYDHADIDLSETETSCIDLINIEEELLDPKWYSDVNAEGNNGNTTQKLPKQYDVLVEEVTPFVQFKENVRNTCEANSENCTTEAGRDFRAAHNNKDNLKPAIQRRRSTITIQSTTTNLPMPQQQGVPDLKRPREPTKLDKSYQVSTSKRCKVDNSLVTKRATTVRTAPPISRLSQMPMVVPQSSLRDSAKSVDKKMHNPVQQNAQPANEKQTAQILNKLQNLGLQIKRTHPLSASPLEASKKTDDKTLEILLKLQSKGMKVKVLNKQSDGVRFKPTSQLSARTANCGRKTAAAPNISFEQNLNKNLIIRKVN